MTTVKHEFEKGRLSVRPSHGTGNMTTGMQTLEFDDETLLYVPKNYKSETPTPLSLMLHGAGGDAGQGISFLRGLADANNLLLLATKSEAASWDMIGLRRYGPDVERIDVAFRETFERCNVDEKRVAIGGFSDGASYALSLGLANGDLFTHVIAFSPGFYHAFERIGTPKIFISHGSRDGVLPIAHCSRRIVKELSDYNPLYIEFDGAHVVPKAVAEHAVAWLLG